MPTPTTNPYQDILMPKVGQVQDGSNVVSPLVPTNAETPPSYATPAWGGIANAGKKDVVATQTQQTGQTQTGTPATGNDLLATPKVPTNLDEIIKMLDDDKEKKDKELKRREEELKRSRTFAAISDALSAFSTAYNNARGVKSAVPAGTSLSGKWRERFDALQKEREANDAAYVQSRMRVENTKNDADYKRESLALRQKEEERRQETAKAQIEYTLSRADAIKSKADYDAAVAEAKIRLMEAGVDEKQANIEAKRIVANSTAAKNYAQAEKARSGGSGGGNGVGEYTTETVVHRDSRGRETGRTTTRKRVGSNTTSTNNKQTSGNQGGKKKKIEW